jgi:alpha-tubulin suppressor-like RCC1 family protein
MPTFYNYRENGVVYSFDDVFVPADAFRQGNLWVWGNNYYGQLGDNTSEYTNILTPITTFSGGFNWKQVSGGGFHTVAIKTDGTLWVWGDNYHGQLGDNTTTNRSTPVTTFLGGTNWKQVSAGSDHCAAIKTDGTLWTWGNNAFGQLGDDTAGSNRLTPVTTFAGGTNWKQVSSGGAYTAAIKTDGTLWSWGQNYYGQLGSYTEQIDIFTPITTFAGGTNWKQVAGGGFHTAAIKTDGTLWTWGRNYGQIGDNTVVTRSTPVTTFAGGTNWKQVSGGRQHTVAIKTDGTLWGWGSNFNGQLGSYTEQIDIFTPVTTSAGGTNWKQVSCGYFHTAAIKTDGTLWGWGRNYSGELGTNGYDFSGSQYTPVTTFAGGTNWKQVSGGKQHTVAVTYIDDYQ